MSKYKPKELPSTGLEPPAAPMPAVRTRGEVMREWEEKKEEGPADPGAGDTTATVTALPVVAPATAPAAEAVDPSWVIPSPMLPDLDAAPEEQLAVCERAIHGAKTRWMATVDAATEEFFAEAGPYIVFVHTNRLYKLMLDNAGRPYKKFERYLAEQHDLKRSTGYRITRTLPLLTALRGAGHTVEDLSSRQVDRMHQVRVQHGDAKVVEQWVTACATKKGAHPTPDELEKAARLLGLTTTPDPDDAPDLPALTSGPEPRAAVEQAAKLLVPDNVRDAVKADPGRILTLYKILGDALTEAGVRVE